MTPQLADIALALDHWIICEIDLAPDDLRSNAVTLCDLERADVAERALTAESDTELERLYHRWIMTYGRG